MYATVFKSDPLDVKRWQRYRESILLPGSSRDELDLLKVMTGAGCATRNTALADYFLLRSHRTSLVDPPTRKLLLKVYLAALHPRRLKSMDDYMQYER